MTYIQDKLDEFDEKVNNTYEFFNATDGGGDLQYTINEIDIDGVRDFIQQSLTDYHNHIVEKIENQKEIFGMSDFQNETQFNRKQKHNDIIYKVLSSLQDTNPKE